MKYAVTVSPLPKEYIVEAGSKEEAFDKAHDLFSDDLLGIEADFDVVSSADECDLYLRRR